jgi:glycosyltransferase AglD
MSPIECLSPSQIPSQALPAGTPGRNVLVTLPVFNEVAILRDSVESLLDTLTAAGIDFNLAIAEDGSTDGTQDCIREIRQRHPTIIVQSDPQRRGRGWALRMLWSIVQADFYAFSDTDFAADPRYLVQAIQIAEKGSAVVTGSRYVPGASVNRPPFRQLISKTYNSLIRTIFGDRVHDHQCGLKVFSRSAVRSLLPLSREDSWFWDTEMLILAKDRGLEVVEIPVHWVERKAHRTQLLRLASDVRLHGTGILRLASNRQSSFGGNEVLQSGRTSSSVVERA